MRRFFTPLITSYLFLISAVAVASPKIVEIEENQALGKEIGNILVQGLVRTQSTVVHRELLIRKGQKLSAESLAQSVTKIKNLRLFSRVQVQFFLNQQDRLHIHFVLSEKITTIPILKLTQGGGSRYLVVGLYDINTLGRYLETGAQYESWNNESGGVLWFRYPRLFDKPLRLGTDLWSVKRPRKIYSASGSDQGDFVSYQRKLNLFIDKEFGDMSLGLGIQLSKTSLLPGLMSSLLSNDLTLAVQAETDVVTTWLSSYISLGRLNYDGAQIRGQSHGINLSYTTSKLGSDYEAARLELTNKWFLQTGHNGNFGAQLNWAVTNSDHLQDLFYVGGFENVRGYFDGQLRGSQYWQANVEYRHTVITKPWYFIQAVLFTDAVQLLNTGSSIETQSNDVFSSAGFGFRAGSTKIYRFIARLDIAVATSHPATSRVSVGVQQFF